MVVLNFSQYYICKPWLAETQKTSNSVTLTPSYSIERMWKPDQRTTQQGEEINQRDLGLPNRSSDHGAKSHRMTFRSEDRQHKIRRENGHTQARTRAWLQARPNACAADSRCCSELHQPRCTATPSSRKQSPSRYKSTRCGSNYWCYCNSLHFGTCSCCLNSCSFRRSIHQRTMWHRLDSRRERTRRRA